MVFLGSDHGGFELKEGIKKHLLKIEVSHVDCGIFEKTVSDYPEIARLVAKNVAQNDENFGIICCGSGIGVNIAANKVYGIRAALCVDKCYAKMARLHNDANIICLGGRFLSLDGSIEIVDVFLTTKFEGGRHKTRVKKIEVKNGRV
ncbi:MAG: ribose 5-phosphate isomerase B [Oscillospiraceae bacterium]|nr:ribose 5-phosphate isomerase B [Oscillospiraceae bacterium]